MPDFPPPSDDTRSRLILAGLHLFGRDGFAATSTRAIAAEAQTNVASISYHFGGKAGLHEACVHWIADHVGAAIGQGGDPALLSPEEARDRLHQTLRSVTDFLLSAPQAAHLASFVTRQLGEQGEGADALYEAIFAPRHVEFCQLWSRITGKDAESEETRLVVFSVIGQVVYFRIAGHFVQRRMGWASPGPQQAAAVADVLKVNLDAIIERHRS